MSIFKDKDLERRIELLEKANGELSKKYAKIWIEQVITRALWAMGSIAIGAWVADITGVLEKLI